MSDFKLEIKQVIQSSLDLKQQMLMDEGLVERIEAAASLFIETYKNGGKILFCGNGGSAADAQHIAAELTGRYYKDRKPLHAEALHANSSFITAVANDYGYDAVYARQVEAQGKKGDLLVAISTSGNSVNVVNAVKAAIDQEMIVISLTGETGGKMKEHSNVLINIPSTDTPRIQECHILIGHILCQLTEEELF